MRFGTATTNWASTNTNLLDNMPILIRDNEVYFLRLNAGILEIAPAKRGNKTPNTAKATTVDFDADDDDALTLIEVAEEMQAKAESTGKL